MCKQLLYPSTGILQFLVRLFYSMLCIPGKSSGRGALRKLCQHQNPSNILRPIERNPSSFTGVGKDFWFLLSSLVSSSKHLNKTYVKGLEKGFKLSFKISFASFNSLPLLFELCKVLLFNLSWYGKNGHCN